MLPEDPPGWQPDMGGAMACPRPGAHIMGHIAPPVPGEPGEDKPSPLPYPAATSCVRCSLTKDYESLYRIYCFQDRAGPCNSRGTRDNLLGMQFDSDAILLLDYF